MPQLVPKINLFIRWGAFEPSTGFHVATALGLTQSNADDLAVAVSNFLPDLATISRWEGVLPDGSVVNSGVIALAGVLTADFDDFRDCTHITWNSDPSAERPSGNFIPGRNDALWTQGIPTSQLNGAMGLLMAAIESLDIRDSEGGAIIGWRRFTASRRPRMRVAP